MTEQQTQKNRNTIAAVYQASELYHHGVQGMSWGERNGPPYPLGGLDKKVARAEAKRKKARERALEKARKAAKKARKAKARDAKREERAAAREEKDQILKEKLLRKGNLDDIQKNRRLFTTQELIDAVNRARVLEEVHGKKKDSDKSERAREEKPKKSTQEILNDVTKFATTVNAIGAAAITTKNLVDGIVKMNRDKELHQLSVEARELTNLKLALGSGVPREELQLRSNYEKYIKKPETAKKVTAEDKLKDAVEKFNEAAGAKSSGNVRDGVKVTTERLGGLFKTKKKVSEPSSWSDISKTTIKDMNAMISRYNPSSAPEPKSRNFGNSSTLNLKGNTQSINADWLNGQISRLSGIKF